MDYTRLQRSINFKPKHMKFFQDNKTNIQEFTRSAVDKEIQRMKEQGQGVHQYEQEVGKW